MKAPFFETEEEAEEFIETHDVAKFMEQWEVVEMEWCPEEDTCPQCGSQMKSRRVDIKLCDRKLEIHNLTEYHCPICKMGKFDTESLKELKVIEAKIQQIGLMGLILQHLGMSEERKEESKKKEDVESVAAD